VILLYSKDKGIKKYYDKIFKSFTLLTRIGATQFQGMSEIYDEVKNLNSNYDSLTNLGTKWINYTIHVKDQRLADTWLYLDEVTKTCESLNEGLNIKIFSYRENIFLEKPLQKDSII
jgi:hypothetical protein